MSVIIPEKDLPQSLSPSDSVEAAYSETLADTASSIQRGIPVLIECDKDMAPFVFLNLRNRLRQHEIRCLYLDGRPQTEEQQNLQSGLLGMMIAQLRDAVRGAIDRRVVVLPHLDLLTTSQGGLTAEAKEVIPLLYENPELVWLGFKDPSFSIPSVIENLFPKRFSILGIPRDRLKALITQKESRKFGREFNPWNLYKYVSGMNAVRLRKLLSTLEGEDYPADPKHALTQIRQATAIGKMEVPQVELHEEIGGYDNVKRRLQTEILDVLAVKDGKIEAQEIQRLEQLIPRGMIFWGPPGTGKTLFAKAMATALGAAITIVSGPELKSRWVGESEERIRQIFQRARQSAPSIIVFDELDSFAAARGTYTGSGVEHSMVNQLLTEMDGFKNGELVFVVGTTNFAEILDPALLRPGRFEFHLHIPVPKSDDRRAILKIYDEKMNLEMDEAAVECAVRRTGEFVEGAAPGTQFTGDHLNALCRSLARIRLRDDRNDATTSADVERALTEWVERPSMTLAEEQVVATHEAGHAICTLFCEHTPPIERISIRGDLAGALGFVKSQDPAQKYIVTQNQLLDRLCVLMGGREAELMLLDDLSIGSSGDLDHATSIARSLVEEFGMGGETVGVGQLITRPFGSERTRQYSPSQLELVERAVNRILETARQRCIGILNKNKHLVETLRDLLLDKKVVDAKSLGDWSTANQVPKQAEQKITTVES
ncbi:MAG: AAA family ATPase [Mariniblastus sp.]|nr:AAA family ATPase [Mariniblastus sp.]